VSAPSATSQPVYLCSQEYIQKDTRMVPTCFSCSTSLSHFFLCLCCCATATHSCPPNPPIPPRLGSRSELTLVLHIVQQFKTELLSVHARSLLFSHSLTLNHTIAKPAPRPISTFPSSFSECAPADKVRLSVCYVRDTCVRACSFWSLQPVRPATFQRVRYTYSLQNKTLMN